MSKIKKISASLMAFALALCVGYFSTMSPTSAWFYDSGVIDSGDKFVFGDLSVDTKFVAKDEISFDGATNFADPDEILFDDVINVQEIQVKNTGTIPARIYTKLVNKNFAKGLRWFAYTDEMLVEGSVKKTLKSVLPELTDNALANYNNGADGKSSAYILCQPGKSLTLKVATWVDYNSVKDELESGKSLMKYDVEFVLTATQNVDGAVNG